LGPVRNLVARAGYLRHRRGHVDEGLVKIFHDRVYVVFHRGELALILARKPLRQVFAGRRVEHPAAVVYYEAAQRLHRFLQGVGYLVVFVLGLYLYAKVAYGNLLHGFHHDFKRLHRFFQGVGYFVFPVFGLYFGAQVSHGYLLHGAYDNVLHIVGEHVHGFGHNAYFVFAIQVEPYV